MKGRDMKKYLSLFIGFGYLAVVCSMHKGRKEPKGDGTTGTTTVEENPFEEVFRNYLVNSAQCRLQGRQMG